MCQQHRLLVPLCPRRGVRHAEEEEIHALQAAANVHDQAYSGSLLDERIRWAGLPKPEFSAHLDDKAKTAHEQPQEIAEEAEQAEQSLHSQHVHDLHRRWR